MATTNGQRREYTPEQRAEALRLDAELGASESAKRLGIPRGTISAWRLRYAGQPPAEPPVTDVPWAQRREELARDFAAAAVENVRRARQATNGNSAKGFMFAAGIAARNAAEIDADRPSGGRDNGPTSKDQLDEEIDRLVDDLVAAEIRRRQEQKPEAPTGLGLDLVALTGDDREDIAQPKPPPADVPQEPPLPSEDECAVELARAELANVEAELAAIEATRPLPRVADMPVGDVSAAIDEWAQDRP